MKHLSWGLNKDEIPYSIQINKASTWALVQHALQYEHVILTYEMSGSVSCSTYLTIYFSFSNLPHDLLSGCTIYTVTTANNHVRLTFSFLLGCSRDISIVSSVRQRKCAIQPLLNIYLFCQTSRLLTLLLFATYLFFNIKSMGWLILFLFNYDPSNSTRGAVRLWSGGWVWQMLISQNLFKITIWNLSCVEK